MANSKTVHALDNERPPNMAMKFGAKVISMHRRMDRVIPTRAYIARGQRGRTAREAIRRGGKNEGDNGNNGGDKGASSISRLLGGGKNCTPPLCIVLYRRHPYLLDLLFST